MALMMTKHFLNLKDLPSDEIKSIVSNALEMKKILHLILSFKVNTSA